jgi:integrase/recombinase XerD
MIAHNFLCFCIICYYFVTETYHVLSLPNIDLLKYWSAKICNFYQSKGGNFMPVYLRQRKGKERSRYYLDIYHDGNRWTESLDLYHINSKGPNDVQANRESKSLAESIRSKRHLDLESEKYEVKFVRKATVRFVDYFENWLKRYPNKDIRLARACYAHFLHYLDTCEYPRTLSSKKITPEFARGFKRYLEQHLNGETPNNYFQKFIKLCNDAAEVGIFHKSPIKGIPNKRPEGLKKAILSLDEIARLKDATCPHQEVRRAFLFSLNTGLRWVDVKGLRWRDIDGDVLRLFQAKTRREVVVFLNKTAISLLGERRHRDDAVFNLPSTSFVTRVLRRWVQNAGIDKHISWHCARHSFAVNLLAKNTDIKSVSSLLGHANLKHTEIYTRVVDELKRKAVESIDDVQE